jgi:hypothetical protein
MAFAFKKEGGVASPQVTDKPLIISPQQSLREGEADEAIQKLK